MSHRESSAIQGTLRALLPVPVVLLLCAGFAAAAGNGALTFKGWPIPWVTTLLAVGIQWLAFVPAWWLKSEHFYDLTGSLSFIAVVAVAFWMAGGRDPGAGCLAMMVTVWAVRLGSFLFLRIRRAGEDKRFRGIRHSAPRFFVTWTLQAAWVSVASSTAVAAISQPDGVALDAVFFAGAGLWLVGFAVEVVADVQKSRFRAKPDNQGRFIQHGLWAWSRHPNYFGEIVLWTGISLAAAGSLSGWQWITASAPVLVALLLTRVSGIPLLERQAMGRWGDDPAYQAYVRSTPSLIPRPPV